ncbi:hypothetical protein Tco_0078911 [Tanacetum coccineum]|uniref:Uncharacterized protein n=1 Tax=Tanacetum coccineum TaxID=301880 RepID=A0ABQ5GU54_9ASTR
MSVEISDYILKWHIDQKELLELEYQSTDHYPYVRLQYHVIFFTLSEMKEFEFLVMYMLLGDGASDLTVVEEGEASLITACSGVTTLHKDHAGALK